MRLASLIGGDDASATLLISVSRWCPLIQRPKTRQVGCNLANRMMLRKNGLKRVRKDGLKRERIKRDLSLIVVVVIGVAPDRGAGTLDSYTLGTEGGWHTYHGATGTQIQAPSSANSWTGRFRFCVIFRPIH